VFALNVPWVAHPVLDVDQINASQK
jgi:hypothetical protein